MSKQETFKTMPWKLQIDKGGLIMGKFNVFGTEFTVARQRRGPEGFPVYQEQAQNQMGVHVPVSGCTDFPGGLGTSEAGDLCTSKWAGKPHDELRERGRELHEYKLLELYCMPKPKLKGI